MAVVRGEGRRWKDMSWRDREITVIFFSFVFRGVSHSFGFKGTTRGETLLFQRREGGKRRGKEREGDGKSK